MYDKIYGCLLGAAAGDALGAATETRTRKQIEEKFGGYVTDFLTPPNDTFARGNRAGQVTDDFSIAYMTLKEVMENNKLDSEVAEKALIKWSEVPGYFDNFAGPTTRSRVNEIKMGKKNDTGSDLAVFVPVNDNSKATNGAGMKSAPIALLGKGDIDRAIEDAMIVCEITHNNNIALSGAGAIAAATAAALKEDATIVDVVRASIYGAKKGDAYGRAHGATLAGASVEEKIKWAVSLALNAASMDEAMDEISDYIGSGLMAVEAVPAAIGLCVAAKNAEEGILAAVNMGNDTDTVATMVGGILGALYGAEKLPKHYEEIIEKENNFGLRELAEKIMEYGK